MPKLPIEKQRELAANKLLGNLLDSEEGVGIRHQLTEPLADLPAGAWIFGVAKLQPQSKLRGDFVVEYTGCSNPPKR